ncbi:MAG: Maf family protein [Candidatus Acidiferrales bacterium]
MKLILASGSPRRAEILRNAGFIFEVSPARIDESPLAGELSDACVRRLAHAKARAAAQDDLILEPDTYIIGADTVVVAEGQMLGKPADFQDARRMLRLLRGKTHEVLTGVSILSGSDGPEKQHVETTRVTMLQFSDSDIDEYLATSEPFDKAGAYGIQGIGGRFVSRVEGCYFNVMGLPLSRVWSMLRALGWDDSSIRHQAPR